MRAPATSATAHVVSVVGKSRNKPNTVSFLRSSCAPAPLPPTTTTSPFFNSFFLFFETGRLKAKINTLKHQQTRTTCHAAPLTQTLCRGAPRSPTGTRFARGWSALQQGRRECTRCAARCNSNVESMRLPHALEGARTLASACTNCAVSPDNRPPTSAVKTTRRARPPSPASSATQNPCTLDDGHEHPRGGHICRCARSEEWGVGDVDTTRPGTTASRSCTPCSLRVLSTWRNREGRTVTLGELCSAWERFGYTWFQKNVSSTACVALCCHPFLG